MPPLVQEKPATRDPVKKKTKSRNGCGRCKLKRLKCDETAPGCLQCKKRNVPCPGYEKTLKWSTKYEVHKPAQFAAGTPSLGRDIAPRTATLNDVTLPPDVVNGFEALAAVLPVGKKRLQPSEEDVSHKGSMSPASHYDDVVPPRSNSHDASMSEKTSSPEVTNANHGPIIEMVDPSALDGLMDSTEVFNQDFTFDEAFVESLNYLESPTIDDLGLEIEEIPRLSEEPTSTDMANYSSSTELANSPRWARSLLLDYYRLPSPGPSSSLADVESILVQHYFKDVCVLFSSFDSMLNPFRTTIGKIFQESSSIYYAIQSMAAAHLANSFPNMTPVGIEMQRKACDALQAELPLVQSGQVSGTTSFLSIMLLGITTSWHESSSLGEDFLTTARSLILPKLLSSSDNEKVQRETQFFEESLIYWEMLMGFVTQDAMAFTQRSGPRKRANTPNIVPAARNRDGKIVPHPWTGIAPTIQILFAEVGRLVRRERIFKMSGADDIRRRQDNLLNAASLEEDLLAAEYPMAEELADPGDERTSKRDFIIIAEAYRCAGLLELYRVFPSILRKRLGTDKFTWTDKASFEFPSPRFETPYEDTDMKLWLNSLALHILECLESLPSSTGTCCLQPILLVAAASELKFVSSIDFFDVHANDSRVMQARQFADKRLHEYALRLPEKPIRRAIDIVKEVWRRLDDGDDAFWIDVMVEKGWHTNMG